jgi:hypothetical protein
MAKKSHRGGSFHKITHAVPGEHFALVRPVRDDLRRSTVDAPRRSRKVRQRQRRKDDRHISRLARDAHKGKAGKTQQNSSTGRQMPSTAKSRPMGSNNEVRTGSAAAKTGRGTSPAKDTGLKMHRPRALNPHLPRAYHVLPARKLKGIL